MKYILIAIIILAAVLRINKLDVVPPSISWDEAAVGYNALSIANYGRDEWGKEFPSSFTSFKDDKNPVHVYSTAVFVKLFGLSEFTTRLPSAVFGVSNVILLYYLSNLIFKNKRISLLASLFLAISPYNLQFSRFNHELNFAVFFFMLGLILFFLSIEKKKYLLPLSFLSFGIDLLTYQSAKVMVPLILLLLIAFYYKSLLSMKKVFLLSFSIFAIFIAIILLNPALLGLARINQSPLPSSLISNSFLYLKTGNQALGKVEAIFGQYITHFSPKFLFISGDGNGRHSTQVVGEFFKIDALFLLVGVITMFWKRSKKTLLLVAWILFAPLPASVVFGAPHAGRALFMTGSLHMVAALGAYNLIFFSKRPALRFIISVIFISVILYQFNHYVVYYYQEYGKKQATEWQYGMKQVVEYVKNHPEYSQVFVTDIRNQPYIFFLYYLQTPQPDFARRVIYNDTEESKDYSLVSYFDRYYFGGWDTVESMPSEGVLYVLTNNQYGGLRHRLAFDVKKIVYYPDGSENLYLVSKK